MNKRITAIVGVVALSAAIVGGGIALYGSADDAAAATDGANVAACDGTGAGDGQGYGAGAGNGQGAGNGHGYAAGNGTGVQGAAHTVVPSDPSTPLTAAEAEGLQFMREEEKLAYDVYVVFGQQYDLRVFANIARAETRHTDAVKSLLDIYSIKDPVGGNGPGVFTDDQLAALYKTLTTQGDDSLSDALHAAVAIEQRDIADLQERIAATDRADLKATYENLLQASRNHLTAFNRQLARVGG